MTDQPVPGEITNYKRTLGRLRRRLLGRHLWLARAALFGAGALATILLLIFAGRAFLNTKPGGYVRLGAKFLFPPTADLRQFNGRTNVLVLGKAGQGHTAPDLTDTVMIASFKHDSPEDLLLISIPRDIWFADLRAKLNSLYFFGNAREKEGGIVLSKSAVEEVVGVPVHYGLVVDFSGFTKIIDQVGGVDVEIEKSFMDERFPVPGREDDECGGDDLEFSCRYETVSFEAGLVHMSGETALKFARSRQSKDLQEGTDLARARRQQKVFGALSKKLASSEVFLSPRTLIGLWDTFLEITETDLPQELMPVLARTAFDARDNIRSTTIPEELLVTPPLSPDQDNLYVFVPSREDGSWEDVHAWVSSLLR